MNNPNKNTLEEKVDRGLINVFHEAAAHMCAVAALAALKKTVADNRDTGAGVPSEAVMDKVDSQIASLVMHLYEVDEESAKRVAAMALLEATLMLVTGKPRFEMLEKHFKEVVFIPRVMVG